MHFAFEKNTKRSRVASLFIFPQLCKAKLVSKAFDIEQSLITADGQFLYGFHHYLLIMIEITIQVL